MRRLSAASRALRSLAQRGPRIAVLRRDSSSLAPAPAAGFDALGLPGSAVELPMRFKGSDFDAAACRQVCDALAESVAAGNHHHVEGLMTALRLMMPAASGAERAFARPREDFILKPEILVWFPRQALSLALVSASLSKGSGSEVQLHELAVAFLGRATLDALLSRSHGSL
eukprot:s262_g24.t1